jgi:hypothetical protein
MPYLSRIAEMMQPKTTSLDGGNPFFFQVAGRGHGAPRLSVDHETRGNRVRVTPLVALESAS